MRDLDLKDIQIRARMYKQGLITEQEMINAVALLQKPNVSSALELLEQEYKRLNDADPATMNRHENLKRVIRKGYCHLAIRLISELSEREAVQTP